MIQVYAVLVDNPSSSDPCGDAGWYCPRVVTAQTRARLAR